MATTTNFGWETPDDTDLVKDGALAIRTLGNSIDTSLVDLKGGTTGQVLSKTSNTDMDFTWVTSDDANAIQNAIVDAKGDLIAASAADTPARLAVGNNGETLVADSSTSTGLRYTAGNALGNPVLNSAYQIWQRGTSISVAASQTSAYTADRWAVNTTANAASTISRQTTSDTTNLPNIQYCLRVQRNSGQTGTTGQFLYQTFESINSIPFAGRAVIVSFYARAGATFLSSGATITAKLWSGTGSDQSILTGFTGQTAVATVTPTLTANWQRFTMTGTVATSATQIAVGFDMGAVGTAGATDFVETTGWQIDLGSVALPFRTYAATLAGELQAAQRYYFRVSPDGAYRPFGTGMNFSTTQALVEVRFPVTMRVRPTALEQSGTAADYGLLTSAAGNNICNAVPTFDNSTTASALSRFTCGSGQVAGNGTFGTSGNVSTAYLAWSAEL